MLCFFLSSTGQTCVDIKDNVVNEGYYFTPKGDDPCLSCTCHDGEPEMCVAALCERPQGCNHFQKDPKECCKFTCLDPGTVPVRPHIIELFNPAYPCCWVILLIIVKKIK